MVLFFPDYGELFELYLSQHIAQAFDGVGSLCPTISLLFRFSDSELLQSSPHVRGELSWCIVKEWLHFLFRHC